MTICAYVGLPGHGKSYGVVENVIKPALEQKRQVFTNIPLNSSACLKEFGMEAIQFETQDIIDNPQWWTETFIPGSLIVIDEIWRLWPSGLNAKNARTEDKSFLAEHRHMVGENGMSTEIVFVTQDLSQIASFARCLVETTYRVVKLSKVGLDKSFRVDVFNGPVTGATPPLSKRDREIHGRFKKGIYALYSSHTKSATGLAGNEKRVDQRFNVMAGAGIKIGALAIILCIIGTYFGIQEVKAFYGLSDSKKEAVVVKPQALPAAVNQTAMPATTAKQVFKFLSLADGVYISFNNGRFPNVTYEFRIVFNDSEATLTTMQLATMDYLILPVSECLVRIEGDDFMGFAACKSDERQERWVDEMITPTAETQPNPS